MIDTRAISGKTRLYCLIGDPVSHSRSPFIMNRALAEAGIDAAYAAFRVPQGALRDAVLGLKALGAAGANVTFPHKEAAAKLLDRASTCVRVVRATNTLHLTRDGLVGHNTDATGVVAALETFAGCAVKEKRALIFGAGGAARAAAFGLLRANVASVIFCARDAKKAAADVAPLESHFGEGRVSVVSTGDDDLGARKSAVGASQILINATPLGMPGFAPWSGRGFVDDVKWITPRHVCFDLAYGAKAAGFLKDSAARGAACLDGIPLLIAQAREAFRIWTGRGFDTEEMRRALEAREGAGSSRPAEEPPAVKRDAAGKDGPERERPGG